MLSLILKLGDERSVIEITNQDINLLLEALKNSIILDSEGDTWIIEPSEELYFDSFPPHFEISCKHQD